MRAKDYVGLRPGDVFFSKEKVCNYVVKTLDDEDAIVVARFFTSRPPIAVSFETLSARDVMGNCWFCEVTKEREFLANEGAILDSIRYLIEDFPMGEDT